MNSIAEKLSTSLMNLATDTINLDSCLCKTYSGRHVYGQLFRACTSAGANYEEARADFVHKMQLLLKELRESNYWLRLIEPSDITKENDVLITSLLNESKELSGIIGKSIITAKLKSEKK